MNQNLLESRTWMKAVRWLALGMVFAVGGCCYSCRAKDSPAAEEQISCFEDFPEEEEFPESEGGTDNAARRRPGGRIQRGFLKKNRRQLQRRLPKRVCRKAKRQTEEIPKAGHYPAMFMSAARW